jgi:hypothetical protein
MMRNTNTVLVKLMLALMDYFSPADTHTPWVTAHMMYDL